MSNVSLPDVSPTSWKELLELAGENPRSKDVASLLQERHVELSRQKVSARLGTKQSEEPGSAESFRHKEKILPGEPGSLESFQHKARALLEEMAIDRWVPKAEETMREEGANEKVLKAARSITKLFVMRGLNQEVGATIKALPSLDVWAWDNFSERGMPRSFLAELKQYISETMKTAMPETAQQRSPLSWVNPGVGAEDTIQAGSGVKVLRQLGRAEQRPSRATASGRAPLLQGPLPQAATSRSPPKQAPPHPSSLDPLPRERLETAPAAVTLRSKRTFKGLGDTVRQSIRQSIFSRKKPPSDGLPADPGASKQSKSRGKALRGKTSVPVMPEPPKRKREPSPPSLPERSDVSTSSVAPTSKQPSGKSSGVPSAPPPPPPFKPSGEPSVVPASDRSRPDRSRPDQSRPEQSRPRGKTSQGKTSASGVPSAPPPPPPPPPFKPSGEPSAMSASKQSMTPGKPSLKPKPSVSVLSPPLHQAKVPAPPKPPEKKPSEPSQEVSPATTFEKELEDRRTLVRRLAYSKMMKEQAAQEESLENSEENSSYTSEEDVHGNSADSSDTSDASEDRGPLSQKTDVPAQRGEKTLEEAMSWRRARMESSASTIDRIKRNSPRPVNVGFKFTAEEVEKYKNQTPRTKATLKSQALRDQKIDGKTQKIDGKTQSTKPRTLQEVLQSAFDENNVQTDEASEKSSDEDFA